MDPQPQTSLGADDYQALLSMYTSPDASARAQAAALGKKMTPDEQQGFFDFQQQANRGKDATAQRVDSNIIGGASGGGIAPEDVLMIGQGVRKIAAGALTSGIPGAIKAAAAEASPVLKYEVARHTMTAIGIPNVIATPIAMVIAGYRKGAPAAERVSGPVDPAAPHLDTSVPVRPSELTQEQLRERMFYGQDAGPRAPAAVKPPLGVRGVRDVLPPDVAPAPPAAAPLDVPARPAASGAPAAAPPSPPGSAGPAPAPTVTNTLPDQKALNEAALAARRAAYQARVQAAAEADARAAQTPAPARVKLTAPESREYLRLRQAGMTDPQAIEALQAARDFQARFGTPTPTVAETKFPKR